MKTYIGITIGPIVETICETTKPAGLWFASSIFSDITRRLCAEIEEQLKGDIFSPYYDSEEATENDGVGKYHDRIFFSTEKYEKAKLDNIIGKVKSETIGNFPLDEFNGAAVNFLRDYLQIKYVVFQEEDIHDKNSLLTISPFLDAIELMKKIPDTQENNPFIKLYSQENVNRQIAKSKMFKGIKASSNQFFTDETKWSIRDIESIACGTATDKTLKWTNYYAVVSADGDNLTRFLEQLNDENVTAFSKACLTYVKKASQMIGAFGGMTIYAGGDDLLFLSPLKNGEENILSLCSRINNHFREIVKEELVEGKGLKIKDADIPTISFGIAVRYKKYPLYEALDKGRRNLEYVKEHTAKNAIAFHIEKHSGQSLSFIIRNDKVKEVNELINREPNDKAKEAKKQLDREPAENSQEDKSALVVQNAIYTLEKMGTILSVLNKQELEKDDYWNRWKNFFDNKEQKKSEGYHEFLCGWFYDNLKENTLDLRVIDEENIENMQLFTMLLRIEKFFREKGEC